MRHLRIWLAGALAAGLVSIVTSGAAQAATPSLSSCQATLSAHEFAKGTLTVATDRPAYTPWFVNNQPANQKGYESAVVYAIAKLFHIPASKVNWVTEPFDSSYTPGTKKFDFDINEISYTPDRAKAVALSVSYYDVQQSIIALKTNPIVTKHTPSELRTYLYGDQIGTTGLSYITNSIKPTRTPRVYSTLDQAVAALVAKQIDALVIDTPTGQYMASAQIVNKANLAIATQVGQFPSVGEHYSLLMQKNSSIAACINTAVTTLRANGTLAALQKKWLGIYTSVPTLKP